MLVASAALIAAIDRLVELSPDIPTRIIEEFKNTYKNSIDLIKPEITGTIISSKVYEKSQIKEIENVIIEEDEIDNENVVKNNFIEKFKQKYLRMPTNDEINDYMELNKISIA